MDWLAKQVRQWGGKALWSGIGLTGCILTLLIAMRLLSAPSAPEETATAVGIAVFAGIIGAQALRVGLNLHQDPQRAGLIGRTTARILRTFAVMVVLLSPVVSIIWTVVTAIGMGENWGWALLTSAVTLVYPILVGVGISTVMGLVSLSFAYVGKRH